MSNNLTVDSILARMEKHAMKVREVSQKCDMLRSEVIRLEAENSRVECELKLSNDRNAELRKERDKAEAACQPYELEQAKRDAAWYKAELTALRNSMLPFGVKVDNWSAVADWIVSLNPDPIQKIPNIRRFREMTEAGLRESKDAIEAAMAVRAGERGCQHNYPKVDPGPCPGDRSQSNWHNVSDWIVAKDPNLDHKIANIKWHRELTGSGLKEAKDSIEAAMNRYIGMR